METTQHETNLITSYVEGGVLVVRIELSSLMQEMVINEVEASIMKIVPRAKTALLVDCGELQMHVSSQFLSALMCIYRNANARGTKLAVCNLSSTLRDGYEVTALTSVIPAYDSVEEAVEDLRQLHVTSEQPKSTRGMGLHQSATGGVQLSRAAIVLAAFAFLFFCSAAFMLGTISMAGQPSIVDRDGKSAPFETAIRGTIIQTSAMTGADAWVIAWPIGYRPRTPLTEAELGKLSKPQASWNSLLSVTRTSANGEFELPARGFGEKTALQVLVLSRNPDRKGSVLPEDAKVLSPILDTNLEFLARRQYKLVDNVEIQPNAITEYRWSY